MSGRDRGANDEATVEPTRAATPKTGSGQPSAPTERDEPLCTICGLRSCWREPGAPGR